MSTDSSPSPRPRLVNRKRPHTKAKSGCVRCKSKKIKCDEGKPSCSHCIRYSEQCEYRPPPITRSHRTLPEEKTSPAPMQVVSPNVDMTDLGLLHNWTIAAYTGFGDKPGDEELWRTDVPRMALQHHYLMHGILAISALHLAHLHPSEAHRYLVKAAEHQEIGLAVFRSYMTNDAAITPQNCHSIIAFGALTIAYAFTWPQDEKDALLTPSPFWRGTLNWAILLRGPNGLRDVMADKQEWLSQGPMAYQLLPNNAYFPLSTQDLSSEPAFAALDKLKVLFHDDNPDSPIYRAVHTSLVGAFTNSPFGTGTIGYKLAVYRWVEAVPHEYLDLLCLLDPVAIVLLAHLCVLIKHAASTYWYMQGAAERTLTVTESLLPAHMHHWTVWPREVVFGFGGAQGLPDDGISYALDFVY